MFIRLPDICKQDVCYPGIVACFARDCVSVKEPILRGCLILMSYVKYK